MGFNDHISKWGLNYGTVEEYEFGFELYMKKDKSIKEINAKQKSYKVAHN